MDGAGEHGAQTPSCEQGGCDFTPQQLRAALPLTDSAQAACEPGLSLALIGFFLKEIEITKPRKRRCGVRPARGGRASRAAPLHVASAPTAVTGEGGGSRGKGRAQLSQHNPLPRGLFPTVQQHFVPVQRRDQGIATHKPQCRSIAVSSSAGSAQRHVGHGRKSPRRVFPQGWPVCVGWSGTRLHQPH